MPSMTTATATATAMKIEPDPLVAVIGWSLVLMLAWMIGYAYFWR